MVRLSAQISVSALLLSRAHRGSESPSTYEDLYAELLSSILEDTNMGNFVCEKFGENKNENIKIWVHKI